MADDISRRTLLKATGVTGFGALAACDGVALPGLNNAPAPPPDPAGAPPPPNTATAALSPSQDGFFYEVQYTDAEWRARLTPAEYKILREGGTERRNSHYLTQTTDTGTYSCKACDLSVYSSSQKTILDIGWVFFHHGFENSVLLGIDGNRIEAHCRRCGSHLGHILDVDGTILHCINGTSLSFKSA